MHTYLIAPEAAVATPVRERTDLAVADTWNLDDIFPNVDGVGRRVSVAGSADHRLRPPAGHAGQRPDGAARSAAGQRRARSARLQGLLLLLAALRRRSPATTTRTAAVSASRCCWRSGVRPRRGSTRNCWRFRATRSRQWFDDLPALALYRFALEELYRQQEHVLDEKGEHLLSLSAQFGIVAGRHLRGAVDGRHEVSDRHAEHGRNGRSHLRALSRDCRDQPQSGGSRQGVRRASRSVPEEPEHLRGALQRRAAARLVPLAGARLQDDARRVAAREQHSRCRSSRT